MIEKQFRKNLKILTKEERLKYIQSHTAGHEVKYLKDIIHYD